MPSSLSRMKFALVIKLKRRTLFGYAMHVCGNEADADDLFQEATKAVLESLDGMRSMEEQVILAYLVMTMTNLFRSQRRKKGGITVGGPHLVEPEPEPGPVEATMELWRWLDDDILEEAAKTLTKQEREAWDLRRKGLSYEQIGSELGMKRGTVGKVLFHARFKMSQKCRELLSRKPKN